MSASFRKLSLCTLPTLPLAKAVGASAQERSGGRAPSESQRQPLRCSGFSSRVDLSEDPSDRARAVEDRQVIVKRRHVNVPTAQVCLRHVLQLENLVEPSENQKRGGFRAANGRRRNNDYARSVQAGSGILHGSPAHAVADKHELALKAEEPG